VGEIDMSWKGVWGEIRRRAYGLKIPPDLIARRFTDEGIEIAKGVRVYRNFTIIDGAFMVIHHNIIRGDRETIEELRSILKDLEKLEEIVPKEKKNHIKVAKEIVEKMIEGLENNKIDKYELCGRLRQVDYVDQILSDVVDYNNSKLTALSREIIERLYETIEKLICKSYIRR